jgi:hypothetical protein
MLDDVQLGSVSFAAVDNPNHHTIAAFWRRSLKEIEELFVPTLLLARNTSVLKLGTIGLDGTKLSRHRHPNNCLASSDQRLACGNFLCAGAIKSAASGVS